MPTIADIRQKYPQYNDLSDQQLADAIYSKSYSDMPRADFDAKIGMTAAPAADPNDNYVSQGLSGFNEGLAKGLGMPVDILSNTMNLGIKGINAATHGSIPEITHPVGGTEMFTDLLSPTIAKPSADPGKQIVRRVTEELGAAAVPGVGIASRAASPVRSLVSQALTTAGAGTGAAVAEQVAPNNPYAELAGEILGSLGTAGAAGLARRAITPNPMSAERAAAATTMRQEGVDLTAGQATGSKGLKYAESELGGGAVSDIMDRQSRQFTRAALSRAGVNADTASPQVINGAFTDLGREFDGLAARNTLTPDAQLGRDLTTMVQEYNSLVPPSSRAPIVNDLLGDVIAGFRGNNGAIDGAAYQAIRSRLDRAARGARLSDPQLSDALFSFRNALDGAMERGMATRNPADLAAWQDARQRYTNLLVIEKAAAGGGEKAGLGIISPAQLKQAAANQNHRAFTRGRSDFTELAKAGQATMTPMPESGTSFRLAARGLANLPAVIGGVAGAPGGLPGVIAGAVAGHAVPALAGRAMLSDLGRAYLGNQTLAGPLLDRTAGLGPLAAIAANHAAPEPLRITVGR